MTAVITGDAGPISLPYNSIELTQAINQLPQPFGQLNAENLFPPEALATQFFEINIENGVLSALPVTGDGPATIARHGAGAGRIFRTPRIQHLDDVKASDILGMIQLASRSRDPETLANLMAKRLMILRRKFSMTMELMKLSALKGVIIDGAGAVIYNLFDAFEITKKIVFFDLSNTAADINGSCDQLYALITQDLTDETMTTVEARVASDFFNKLITHPKVEKFWLQTEQAQALINAARGQDGQYRPRTFTIYNVTFIEYQAVMPMWGGGGSVKMIAPGKGHAYPAGTQDSHVTYVSPPEDIAALDGSAADITDLIHITTELMKHNKGVEMLGQSNALAMWRRPNVLVELDAGPGSSTAPIG